MDNAQTNNNQPETTVTYATTNSNSERDPSVGVHAVLLNHKTGAACIVQERTKTDLGKRVSELTTDGWDVYAAFRGKRLTTQTQQKVNFS